MVVGWLILLTNKPQNSPAKTMKVLKTRHVELVMGFF
jgi:hypothetical protein